MMKTPDEVPQKPTGPAPVAQGGANTDWDPKDIQYLIDHYEGPLTPLRPIAEHLGRTNTAISQQIYKLRAKKIIPPAAEMLAAQKAKMAAQKGKIAAAEVSKPPARTPEPVPAKAAPERIVAVEPVRPSVKPERLVIVAPLTVDPAPGVTIEPAPAAPVMLAAPAEIDAVARSVVDTIARVTPVRDDLVRYTVVASVRGDAGRAFALDQLGRQIGDQWVDITTPAGQTSVRVCSVVREGEPA